MRGLWVVCFTTLAALASANAVMGYALEQYDGRAWLVYVVATVIFEAWAIGRWAKKSWPKAIGISVAANFVTAGCCANLCGVGLHGAFVGSRINPNPFLNMVVMFTVFGAISGLIEAVVWELAVRQDKIRFAARSLVVHLAWVPVGIVIMLVPSRPYPMLEAYTTYARRYDVTRLEGPLNEKIAETGRIPDYRDTVKLFEELGPKDDDSWTLAYRPSFSRFSVGQTKGELFWEWNSAVTGLKVDSDKMPEHVWLLRPRNRRVRIQYGLVWSSGGVGFAHNQYALDH